MLESLDPKKVAPMAVVVISNETRWAQLDSGSDFSGWWALGPWSDFRTEGQNALSDRLILFTGE
jgi:hypothetical protein